VGIPLKQWKMYLLIAAIVLFVCTNFYVIFYKESKIPRSIYINQISSATKDDIKETIQTVGIAAPSDQQYIYYNPELGTIDEILVKKGQEVQIGTPLWQYETTELDNEKERLELKKQRIHEQIDKLTADIEQYETMKSTLQAENLDEEQLNGELQKLEQNIKQAEYEQALLEIELEEYDQQLNAVTEKSEKLVVKSEISGVVEEISYDTNKPLITIASIPPVIKGKISEEKTGKLSVGQKAIITAAAIPSQKLTGSIIDIGKLPIKEVNFEQKSDYPFTVQLDKQAEQLRIGYHVDITIITKEKSGAIVVPDKAVWTEGKKSFVYAIKDGKLEKRKVKVGMKQGTSLEILEGLKEREFIALNPTKQMKDGMAVITPLNWEQIDKKTMKEWSKREMLKHLINGFFE
jgi:HlyD family secretion protein